MSAASLRRLVVDTNVLVSANLKPHGAEALVVRLALNRRLQLYLSPALLAEYEAVLRRPRFRFVPAEVDRFLAALTAAGILVRPTITRAASPDPDDNRFLECAEAASADFLVTGNRRHFPARWHQTQVVTARELLDQLGPTLFPPLPSRR